MNRNKNISFRWLFLDQTTAFDHHWRDEFDSLKFVPFISLTWVYDNPPIKLMLLNFSARMPPSRTF